MSSVLSSLNKRLDKHFVACAAAAAAGVVGLSAAESDAAIVYSGPLNLMINPNTPTGIYIRVQDFNITTDNTITGNTNPGWNFNIFNVFYTQNYTGNAVYPRVAATDDIVGVAANSAAAAKLAAGTTIGPASVFAPLNGNGLNPMQVFYPDGSDFGLPWQDDGSTGFLGFRVTFPDTTVHFGWMRVQMDPWTASTANPGAPGSSKMTLIDMAYEGTAGASIQAGAGVPEPTSAIALGMLALGALGVRRRGENS
jgi:hypothetical protein